MMKHEEVFILILNWNGWQDTLECLESLQRLTYPDYRIVVIDNGSTDESVPRIKDWATGVLPVESNFLTYGSTAKPIRVVEYDRTTAEAGGVREIEAEIQALPPNQRLVLIKTGANLGYAGGNNVGIRYALKRQAACIWLLNNDTVTDQDALIEMVKLSENDKSVGIVGSKIFYYDNPKILWAAGGGYIIPWLGKVVHIGISKEGTGAFNEPLQVGYVTGCSMLVRREVLEKVGLLNEAYFLYWEDTDFNIRTGRAGWRRMYCPSSKVWHKASGENKRSARADYFSVRNGLRFARKYHKRWLPLVMGAYLIKILKRILKGQFVNSLWALKGYMAFLRGVN